MHDVRYLIDANITLQEYNPTIWISIVPFKIICFVWMDCLNQIPTALALTHKEVKMFNTSCFLCNARTDKADHILVNCSFLRNALDWIFSWCGVLMQSFKYVCEFINFAANWGHCPKRRKIFLAIFYGFLWCTWNLRNDSVFNKICCYSLKLVNNIVTLVFSFMVHRGKFGNCT